MRVQFIITALLIPAMAGCALNPFKKRSHSADDASDPGSGEVEKNAMATALLPAEANGTALVVGVKGSAGWTSGEESGRIRKKLSLHEGATVHTAAKSHVDLHLGPNGPKLGLGADGELELARLRHAEGTSPDAKVDTRISLATGELDLEIGPLGESSRYLVELPDGMLRTRNAKLRVRVTDQSEVLVWEGCVETEWFQARESDAKRVTVCAGQGYVLGQDAPRPLTQADLDARRRKSRDSEPYPAFTPPPLLYHHQGPR